MTACCKPGRVNSQDVRAVGGPLDLHRGEEPAIETRRLVLILLGDPQRLAVLFAIGRLRARAR